MDDIVCNGCSLLCDDVAAEVTEKDANSLGLCRLGHQHLLSTLKVGSPKAIARDHGKETTVSIADALKKAAKLLLSSKKSILYGWSRSTNETIVLGLELAKALGGIIDTPASLGMSQALSHKLHSMELGIDLDYVRNNGELIIYWGSDPTESCHRHPSKFAVLPRGENIPQGIESRTIGVVDVRNTETMKMANHRLIIPPGRDSEIIETLASEISGVASITRDVAGITPQELIGLVRNIQKADCTVIFYGSGVINSGNANANLSAFQAFVEAVRGTGKEAYALPMAPECNIMGVTKTISADKSTPSISNIAAGEFDVALIVGDDALVELPGSAAKALAQVPLVYIGPSGITGSKARVSIYTTDDMVLGTGSMNRLDLVEIGLKQWNAQKEESLAEYDAVSQLLELVRKEMS
jgi:formylmethanofuran dehydrogenase subunit B